MNEYKREEEDENKKEREDLFKVLGEDATKYGEFVSSYFAWIPLSKQKETAEELENITEDKNKNKEKIKNRQKQN